MWSLFSHKLVSQCQEGTYDMVTILTQAGKPKPGAYYMVIILTQAGKPKQ